MVAERLSVIASARWNKTPVAEMKKLKYEDIRKTLIMDYRARASNA